MSIELISKEAVLKLFATHDGKYLYEAIRDMPSVKQEPNTMNGSGADCISREQALVAIRNLYPGMPRVDFNGSLRKWVDKYKPYIECDDAIKELPSATPQEPKTGHWIAEPNCWLRCSECGEHYPHISIYEIKGSNYCPNCGAKMDSEVSE